MNTIAIQLIYRSAVKVQYEKHLSHDEAGLSHITRFC